MGKALDLQWSVDVGGSVHLPERRVFLACRRVAQADSGFVVIQVWTWRMLGWWNGDNVERVGDVPGLITCDRRWFGRERIRVSAKPSNDDDGVLGNTTNSSTIRPMLGCF